MEDAADAVIPLRPGFDIQIRGFHRNQVIEHIELLEDQLKLVTIDRNESAQLNADLRRLCDDTRNALDQAEARLKRIGSSDTGLPAASQRVQNMLTIAEEEVQTLRDQARRQAEIIRGTAENEARELIAEAEKTARELRSECATLVASMEHRRDELRREHDQRLSELRNRERRMRQAIRDEYKKTMAAAQEEADELIAQTRKRCAQWDAESERLRLEALEEIGSKSAQLARLRSAALAALEQTQETLTRSTTVLREVETGDAELTEDRQTELDLPLQREDVQTFTIELEPSSNGSGPQPKAVDAVRRH
ncbi:hypothetical protein A8924_1699 [Saccharopolyspora erythraea NRRL 2338]|uniref:Myosin n=2 Tax=Saccharopolyspora erythraea TaxID=1836 RepID=A0ABN1DLM3_SACER|nr:hypothetical protein [Saccharopolyspora erythraea]EQD86572.1 hypothetical protein N599_08900 [Saccharopolyspora erythraea D]PFG94418.1 hypothetical protein A8924_1699 [Saccharopolyspora erythraea NRRL 2338]QRK91178.1 hypothetical protein JQX30_07060 [Saccharopolyspora erythraea]CAM00626.1 probable myosin [Saccharopolyspora erythraea NRRL 2338]